MAVTVKLRHIRHSAKKLRPVARLFVGKNLQSSIDTASLMSQDSAHFLYKAFLMAKAAAEQKEFDAATLTISTIMATEGPRIKRMRANARGRGNRYQKHLAHLVVSVDAVAAKPKTTKKAKATTPAKKESK